MPKALTTDELRTKFREFFESKGHSWIPSASLIPENDPSVLFTTAGMHPLVPYLQGEQHPAGQRLADVQKCLRTTDIDDVGDATHATLFEMLGNWSLGDYFKQDAITWSWEFLTSSDWLGIDPANLAVSVFGGDQSTSRDEESAAIWQEVGVPTSRIAYLGVADNWWPAYEADPPSGPQGPDTEIFYWISSEPAPASFDPQDDRWVEIWNNVFMQFNRGEDGALTDLPQQNVDTGMGLERVVMTLNGFSSVYEIDTFEPLMAKISAESTTPDVRHQRILADHIKAATFLLADEHPVQPSNTDQGYVLRRLIRRATRSAKQLGLNPTDIMSFGLEHIVNTYQLAYPSLAAGHEVARSELLTEIERFEAALERGLRELETLTAKLSPGAQLSGEQVFHLYQTHGFPLELTIEIAAERGFTVDEAAYEAELTKHQDASRQATAGKFAGGLADHSEMSVKYHTATHLLHQALRDVLGDHVFQKGSNITAKRLRFDFSHPEKLTDEERTAVEAAVNEVIGRDLPVTREEMSVPEAKERGALGLFEDKYQDTVSVYTMGDYSCEICGGPHVEHTGVLGTFKITKEESAGSGIRRIKAVLL